MEDTSCSCKECNNNENGNCYQHHLEQTGTVNLGYYTYSDQYYPTAILEFTNANKRDKIHPTQKPVELLEYLIKTYTLENEIVLDFTMGSGSAGVACLNTNRKFIGIELDDKYFNIAKNRIENMG